MLRRPPRPTSVDGSGGGEEPAPVASGRQMVASSLAARAVSAALICCLVAGPVGLLAGGLALVQAAAPAPAAPASVDLSGERAAAGEFAQRVVVAWLTSTRDHPEQLAALVPAAEAATMPAAPFGVANPAVSAIRQVGGVWSVTVAATVTDARKTTARRFFQVPVTVAGDGAVAALSLPAPVAGPTVAASATELGYPVQVSAGGLVGAAVTQFLAAYLAGSGDVTRYVTPGVQLSAVAPAPYTAVRVRDLLADVDVDTADPPPDDTAARLLVTAEAAVTGEQTVTAGYALTVTARAGRWEVSAIDPTPLVASSPAAAPAASPNSSIS